MADSRRQPYVAALVEHAGLRKPMELIAAGVARIRYCSTMRELCDLVGAARPMAVVAPISDSGGDDIWAVVKRVGAEDAPPRLLIYTDLTQPAARVIAALASHPLDFRFVLRSEGIFATEFAAILNEQRSAYARTPLLREMQPRLTGAVAQILMGSVFLGVRKTGPGDLAAMCTMSVRSIEHRLAQAGLRTPHWILGWMCTLHSLWRLEQLQRDVKEVARTAGFETRQAFTNYVRRYAGFPPVSLLAKEGFHGAMRRFARQIAERDVVGG